MKKVVILLMLLPFFFSCKKNDKVSKQARTCLDARFDKYTIGVQECMSYNMYLYEGEYWTVFDCCVCDMAPMAVDCDGNQLCEWDEDCMVEFFKKAEFLFTFS